MSSYDPSEVIGRRMIAGFIDLVVVFALMVPVGILFGQGSTGHGRAGVELHGASVYVWAAVALSYYGASEAVFARSLGKLALRLRVTSPSGERASVAAIGARTVLRIVDFLPGLYLLGFVVMLASRQRAARIGDLVAGTRVVAVPVAGTQHPQPA